MSGVEVSGTSKSRGASFGLRRWFGVLGLCLAMSAAQLVCPVGEVHAQDELSEEERTERSKAFYTEGRAAFMKNDWATAADRFEKAYALRNVPKLLQFIAQSYDRMGKIGEALRYLKLYAASSDAAAAEVSEQIRILEPIFHKQMVLSASSNVADAVAMATPGKDAPERKTVGVDLDGPVFEDVPFSFYTEPPGATVYLNDKAWGAQGESPYSMALFPGKHIVWIEKDFHEPVQTEIIIKPITSKSKPQSLRVELVRQVVPVTIKARPETAEIVYISPDGEKRRLGVGKWSGELPAGPAKFLAQATGVGQRQFEEVVRLSAVDETGSQSFVFNLRGAADVNTELVGRSGKAELASATLQGRVFIDGQYIGSVPGTVSKTLSPGAHRVEIRQEGFFPWSSEIEIAPEETLEVELPQALVAVPESGPNWGGIVFTTVGAAALATGGVFTFSALEPDTLTILDDKDQAQLTSIILYGAGGAALATGIIFFAVGGDDDPQAAAPRWMVSPWVGGWGVSLGGPLP